MTEGTEPIELDPARVLEALRRVAGDEIARLLLEVAVREAVLAERNSPADNGQRPAPQPADA